MQKKGFHVHVDSCQMTEAFSEHLEGMGFWKAEFVPVEERSFAPDYHYTQKPRNTNEYQRVFRKVKSYWEQEIEKCRGNGNDKRSARGYIEGECITVDERIEESEVDREVPMPFQVTQRELRPNEFRESEIHITLNRDASDELLKTKLKSMGFFLAANRKDYGVANIFTIQGTLPQIKELAQAAWRFVSDHGGAVNCKIKEERIANWWISDAGVALPPVIDKIHWT